MWPRRSPLLLRHLAGQHPPRCHATPAGIFSGIRSDSVLCAAPTGAAGVRLRSDRRGSPGDRLLVPRDGRLRHIRPSGRGLRRRVWHSACPRLKSLRWRQQGSRRGGSPTEPSRGENRDQQGSGNQTKNTKDERRSTYLERALSLCFCKLLLGARVAPPAPADRLAGGAPEPASPLDSVVRPRVASPAAGAGDLLPAAGAGDLLPTAETEASTPAYCWTGGWPPDTPVSGPSGIEGSSSSDEESGSGVDSGVASGERPCLSRFLFSFSCSSFIFLFLTLVAFSSSFLFFSAFAHMRFAVRVSGSGGSEVYPLQVSPWERD